jgi:ABC-type phosphate transport system permease subunit
VVALVRGVKKGLRMKNVKAIGMLLAALVLGLVAAVYAASWASRQSDGAATRVVVAAVDVELGTRLTPEMLTLVDWPTRAACCAWGCSGAMRWLSASWRPLARRAGCRR